MTLRTHWMIGAKYIHPYNVYVCDMWHSSYWDEKTERQRGNTQQLNIGKKRKYIKSVSLLCHMNTKTHIKDEYTNDEKHNAYAERHAEPLYGWSRQWNLSR